MGPFIGALCVLSVLWIVNEVFNHKLLRSDDALNRHIPRALQYGTIQMAFFVLGMMLAMGVVQETGILNIVVDDIDVYVNNQWIIAVVAGIVSSVLDNFATAISFFSLHTSPDVNGAYWKIIAYTTVVGGNVLTIGSIGGLALMKAERMHVGWYFRNIGLKSIVGGILGLAAMYFII